MMKYIELDECIHGHLYKLHCRNLSIGIFNYKNSCFVGIRRKFIDEFLDIEYHYDTGAPYGTAKPILYLGSTSFEININNPGIVTSKQYNEIFNYLKEKEEEINEY